MRLTILTTITNPKERQDKWQEAINCYLDIADEVVIVCGSPIKDTQLIRDGFLSLKEPKIKFIHLDWPDEWNWIELPRHLNMGLEAMNTDWCVKVDIDQFFHERDKKYLIEELENASYHKYPVTNFSKFTVYSPYKMFQKGQVPIAINRSCKDICFGLDTNKRSDLCYPILKTGVKNINGYDLPVGNLVSLQYRTRIKLYNYDYFFKDLEFSKKEFDRFSRAYKRFFGSAKFNAGTFLNLREQYKNKASYEMKLEDHPIYIREAVKEVIDKNLKVVGNL